MLSTDPIYSTSDLCKINPKNPGCGDGSGGNQVQILDPTNENAVDDGNSGGGGGNENGGNSGGGDNENGGNNQPNNGNGGENAPQRAPAGGTTGPDYSAEGIAKRKAALIAAISKNVPGLELTPDDLVPISPV